MVPWGQGKQLGHGQATEFSVGELWYRVLGGRRRLGIWSCVLARMRWGLDVTVHTDSFQSQKHSVCTHKAGQKCQEVNAPKSDLWSTRNRKELVDKSPVSLLIGGKIPKRVPSSLSSLLRVESHLPTVITLSLIYLLLIFLPCLTSPDPLPVHCWYLRQILV